MGRKVGQECPSRNRPPVHINENTQAMGFECNWQRFRWPLSVTGRWEKNGRAPCFRIYYPVAKPLLGKNFSK